jgi:taurine dioxygenase
VTLAVAPASSSDELTIRPLGGRLGAVIDDVDLAAPQDDATIAAIRLALARHRVIFFQGQDLAPEDQLAFAGRFGPVTLAHPNAGGSEHDARLLELTSTRINHWHSDVSFIDHPPLASLLVHVHTPEFGGDTAWADTAAAYSTLPEPLRDLADHLDVIHSNLFDYANQAPTDDERRQHRAVFESLPFETAHPLVRLVEETGERALYLGGFATRIEGLTPHQSRVLIDLYQSHIEHVNHTIRWHWSPGDVAFWDNRSTQHTMVDDLPSYEGRHVRRVTIAGGRAVGPDGRTSRNRGGDASSYTPVD